MKILPVSLAREFARAAEAISKNEQMIIETLQMQNKVGEVSVVTNWCERISWMI
jgi:hypothetical protein